MQKRWVLKSKTDVKITNKLREELNINAVLTELLVSRGIGSFDEAKQFFRPQLSDLHDPFLMQDMEKAISRRGNICVESRGKQP